MNDNKAVFKVIIAGDLLPSTNNIVLFEKGNAQELLGAKMCEIIKNADYFIVNLEGALTDSLNKLDKIGPVLNAPTSTIEGIKQMGVSAVALANNHIMDYRQQGYYDTVRCLEKAGIQYVGSGSNIDEVKTHISLRLGKMNLCIYNVSETFYNIPDKHTAGANLYDEYVVCNELKELKKNHDYLIVIYHGGAEYFPYPTPMVRKRFHRMADSGADFITAQHTHCIGCEEYYKGSYLLYGQGNFLFARQWTKKMTREGLVMEICFNVDKQSIVINKHKICVTDKDVLRYASDQSLDDFYERSRHIEDEEMIISEYERIISSEIMNRYLLSFNGQNLRRKIALRLFRERYLNHLSKSYTKEQILRNLTVVNQDRRQEDLRYVWNYMFKYYCH